MLFGVPQEVAEDAEHVIRIGVDPQRSSDVDDDARIDVRCRLASDFGNVERLGPRLDHAGIDQLCR